MTRKSASFWFFLLPDVVILYASLLLALYIRYGPTLSAEARAGHFAAFSLIFIFWLLIFFSHGLFEVESLRRYSRLFFNLLSAMLVNFLLAVTFFYFQPGLILTPRRFLLLQIALAFVLFFAWRLMVKSLLQRRVSQGLYLFSFNNELKELEAEIRQQDYLGFKVLGHLSEETLAQPRFSPGDGIVLPENLESSPGTLAKFYRLRTLGVNFYNHKDLYEQLLRRVYLSQLSELWFLENIDYREKRIYNLVKRLVDLALGVIGFLVFILTLPVIALPIKFTSPGGIFFVQERIGKNGRRFNVYKYRTMQGGPTNTWTSVNDPRITRLGKFFRLSRLDELPQFINLLLGNMSLVGPRPEQPHIAEDLKRQIPFYDERHLVKPGLTGWAQLNVYASNLEESKLKLQYDLYYIKNRSLAFDLEVIIKTLYYIFTLRGR